VIINAIKQALENMKKEYCKLSQIDYSQITNGYGEELSKTTLEEKYLERPFAYEFYHQLRKLIDSGEADFGGPIIQAEVDKEYQHCFKKGKIPDFIIHVPSSQKNLAVIEFKLATNPQIENDLQKLVEFKKHPNLEYDHAIEVIIGNKVELERVKKSMEKLSKPDNEEIITVWFNTDSWQADESTIRY